MFNFKKLFSLSSKKDKGSGSDTHSGQEPNGNQSSATGNNNDNKNKSRVKDNKRLYKSLVAVFFIVSLLLLIILIVSIGYWLYSSWENSAVVLSDADIMSYSMGLITLLVTVMTIGIALMGVLGYSSLKHEIEQKAKDSVKKEMGHNIVNAISEYEEINNKKIEMICEQKLSEHLNKSIDSIFNSAIEGFVLNSPSYGIGLVNEQTIKDWVTKGRKSTGDEKSDDSDDLDVSDSSEE